MPQMRPYPLMLRLVSTALVLALALPAPRVLFRPAKLAGPAPAYAMRAVNAGQEESIQQALTAGLEEQAAGQGQAAAQERIEVDLAEWEAVEQRHYPPPAAPPQGGLEEFAAKAVQLETLIPRVLSRLDLEESRGRGRLRPTIAEIHSDELFTDAGVAYLPGLGRRVVIGDLHGDAISLERLLAAIGYDPVVNRTAAEPLRLVFVGDYIDVGPRSLDVVLRVFTLKVEDPEHVILMGGNHDRDRATHDAPNVTQHPHPWFFLDLERGLGRGRGQSMYDQWMSVVQRLPVLTVTQNREAIVHASPPSILGQSWNPAQGLLGIAGRPAVLDQLAWNLMAYTEEPHDRPNDPARFSRISPDLPAGYWIGRDGLETFLNAIGATVLLRGHARNAPWDRATYESRVLTLFSSDAQSPDHGYPRDEGIVGRYAALDQHQPYTRLDPATIVHRLWKLAAPPRGGLEETAPARSAAGKMAVVLVKPVDQIAPQLAEWLTTAVIRTAGGLEEARAIAAQLERQGITTIRIITEQNFSAELDLALQAAGLEQSVRDSALEALRTAAFA